MKDKLKQFLLLIFISVLCSQKATAVEKIMVFAAASLTNALEDIAQEYEQQNKEVKIVLSFASSSILARQIEHSAPADIFISADQQWMDYLSDKHCIDINTRITLLANELVLVVPNKSTIQNISVNKQTDWMKLLNGGRFAIGDPDHVPVGRYAKEAFEDIGGWEIIQPVLARADNVRSSLLLIERNESPLGVIYGSDAIISNSVRVVGRFPADSHTPVEYPLAMIKEKNNRANRDFYQYLRSDNAKSIFIHYGFVPL